MIYKEYQSPFSESEDVSIAYKVSFYNGSSFSLVALKRGDLAGFRAQSNTMIKRGVRAYLRSFSLSETETECADLRIPKN